MILGSGRDLATRMSSVGVVVVVGCRGGDRFLNHHELRPSVGPVLNPYPHNGVCVYRHKAEVSAYAVHMLVL